MAMSDLQDLVLCMGQHTDTAWQSVLGPGLKCIIIKTPEDGGWHKTQSPRDLESPWPFVAREIRATVASLQGQSFGDLHVFATGPYGLGALLACELEYHVGRWHKIHVYQFDQMSKSWVNWGLLGHATASAPTPVLLPSLPDAPDPTVRHLAVSINVLRPIVREEAAGALSEPGLRWIDINGPERVRGPAEAAQLAGELDTLLRVTLPERFPNAELHLFYGGPLGAWMLGAAKLHLCSRPLTVYDRISVGNAFRFEPVLKLPARRLCFGDGVIFLAVIDEWRTKKGGISSFNRELCLGLAAQGYRVLCLMTGEISGAEVANAAAAGVQLLFESQLPQDRPDVIIGHDHITGEAALKLRAERYPRSRVVALIHTAPDEIAWQKGRSDEERGLKARTAYADQVKLAGAADLVFGVGPALTDFVADGLRANGAREDHVRELRPWLLDRDSAAATPPRRSKILLVGRPEHVRLKGIDVAVRAVERLRRRPDLQAPLYVRGAAPGTTEDLREELKSRLGADLRFETFDDDEARSAVAYRSASVVLMPSRSEGFGLVGLEAISHRVPVLVSDQSGLAEVLREVGTPAALSAVVPVVEGDDEETAERWAQALEQRLLRPDQAFDDARQLLDDLRGPLGRKAILTSFVAQCLQADTVTVG